jgi:hypothetical protein
METERDNILPFRQDEGGEPQAIQEMALLQQFEDDLPEALGTGLERFNARLDPDWLVFLDEPELVYCVEGVLATLDSGGTEEDGVFVPLRRAEFRFFGDRFEGVTEVVGDKICLYMAFEDCERLIAAARSLLKKRGL